jgi:hypothetical protein
VDGSTIEDILSFSINNYFIFSRLNVSALDIPYKLELLLLVDQGRHLAGATYAPVDATGISGVMP